MVQRWSHELVFTTSHVIFQTRSNRRWVLWCRHWRSGDSETLMVESQVVQSWGPQPAEHLWKMKSTGNKKLKIKSLQCPALYCLLWQLPSCLKPIFHCNAKPLAWVIHWVGYANMLVPKNAKIWVTSNAKHKICVTPNAKPQSEPMEYRLRWVPNSKFSRWPCTFHVVCAHFICVG